MKKTMYYVMPFIIVPCSLLLSDFLDNMNLIEMSPYALLAMLFIISAIVGNFTPTHKKFDYIITAIMPLTLFCTMFIGGFFDKGCSGEPQLSFDHALNVAFQPLSLVMYLIMAFTAFLASFRTFRILKRNK